MVRGKEPARAALTAMLLLGLLLIASGEAKAQVVQGRTVSSSASKGLSAIDAAARGGKYLFVFFWKENDEQSRTSYGVFQSTMAQWAPSADSIGIQITDPSEKAVVDKFAVSRAPMPLVLALAPNGAVTKAWPIRFTEQQLREGFVSRCTAQCMKALQDRKLVLLCIGNQQTPYMQAALRGAQEFKTDARFASATEIVTLDPADREETPLLSDLQVDPRNPQPTTVLLAPPGQPIARFTGAVTKDQIVAKVQAGPCAGGQCGPGGCGPKK